MIEGERVNLRRVREDDAEFLYNIVNSEEGRKYISVDFSDSLKSAKEWIREQTDGRDSKRESFIIETKNGDRAGSINLFNINRHWGSCDIGLMYILRKCRGCGFAREAVKLILNFGFNGLGLHKIKLFTHNPRMVEIAESVGMEKEGELREEMRYKDDWYDVSLFSILEDEFRG